MHTLIVFFGLPICVAGIYAIVAPRIARKHWSRTDQRVSFDEFYHDHARYWVVGVSGFAFFRYLRGGADQSRLGRDSVTDDEAKIIKACQDDLGDLQGLLHVLALAVWGAVLVYSVATA